MNKTSPSRLATARAYKREHREELLQKQRDYNAARLADPERRATKLKQDRASRKQNYAKRKQYDEQRDSVKVNARNLIRNHIYRGTLSREPCEKCAAPNAHAHHDDYNKPTEVRWLCPKHHKEAHRE